MTRRLTLLAAILLLGAAGPAWTQDPIGTLTLFSADGQEHRDYKLATLLLRLSWPAVPLPDGSAPPRQITVIMMDAATPDALLLGWAAAPGRQATLRVANRPDGDDQSIFALSNATVRFSAAAVPRNGSLTAEINAEHLTINGQRVY